MTGALQFARAKVVALLWTFLKALVWDLKTEGRQQLSIKGIT